MYAPKNRISEKAVQRINDCREKKNSVLNLSNCGLTTIPSEIFEFRWLKVLNLGNEGAANAQNAAIDANSEPNRYEYLETLPDSLGDLQALIMANCGVSEVGFIQNLTNLTELYLRGNAIVDIAPLFSIILNKKLAILDLSKNPIKDITILGVNHVVDANGASIDTDNYTLIELNLERTDITEINSLSKFYSLEKLNIDVILPQLNARHLPFMALTDLRVSALDLINFETFNGLKNLETLYLTFSKGDISLIKTLTKLTNLTIQSSQISDLSSFENLKDLREINLSNNLISDISPLAKLENLEAINLENNQIVDISPLIGLKKLNFINLTSNKIKFVEPLTQLERVVVLSDKLQQLNDELGIKSDNMPSITAEIALRINDNPIEDFPLNRLPTLQSLQDIKNYFAEDSQNRTIKHRDVKLILVGNSASGKTTLANLLRGRNFNAKENSTHGVMVNRQKVGDLFVNFWDFGGQEYYHGTHRLFFSRNAVYILLWNRKTNGYEKKITTINRKGKAQLEAIEHFHYSYWLDNIRAFAPITDSENNDIAVVQTRIDEPDNGKQNVASDIIDRYKIAADYYLSLKPAEKGVNRYKYGFESFKEELLEKAAQNIEADFLTPTEDTIRQWFCTLAEPNSLIINTLATNPSSINPSPINPLESIVEQDCFVKFDKFEQACAKHFKTTAFTRSQLETLVATLHDAGIVLYYRTNAMLRQKIYFAPQRVTAMMYKILDEKTVLKNNGAFTPAHTVKMLKGNVELARDMEMLMMEFGVILPFPNKLEPTSFVTPQYLPDKHDINDIFTLSATGFGDKAIALKLPVFYYRNAMTRLLNQYATASSGRIFWKNGLLFTQNDARVFIRGELTTTTKETNEATLTIAVSAASEGNQRAKQIEILREIFKSMHPQSRVLGDELSISSYDFLDEFKDRLRVSAANSSDFVPIFELKKQANAGLAMAFWNNKRQNINGFNVVLEAINIEKPTPSVFISYSHDDKAQCDELLTYLGVIERNLGIKIWTDAQLETGEVWEREIKEKLSRAEVVVLLVSASFLKSNFIYNKELMPTLQAVKNNGSQKIIPVLIKKTPKLPELWDLQFVPQNEQQRLQAVSSWVYQDDAWTQIAEAIGKAFK